MSLHGLPIWKSVSLRGFPFSSFIWEAWEEENASNVEGFV